MLKVISSFYPCMESTTVLVAKLDVVCAFATISMASENPWTRPKLTEDGDLLLKNSRHPLLEADSKIECVPNDCEMKRGESKMHIITGPNMGGKSTYIR